MTAPVPSVGKRSHYYLPDQGPFPRKLAPAEEYSSSARRIGRQPGRHSELNRTSCVIVKNINLTGLQTPASDHGAVLLASRDRVRWRVDQRAYALQSCASLVCYLISSHALETVGKPLAANQNTAQCSAVSAVSTTDVHTHGITDARIVCNARALHWYVQDSSMSLSRKRSQLS